MQLYGCYSWRVVEKPEPDSHIKIYTKNNKVVESKNWRCEDEKFIGDMGEEKLEGYKAVKVETMTDKKEIYKIEEEYLNILRTSILIAGIIIAGYYIFTGALDQPKSQGGWSFNR